MSVPDQAFDVGDLELGYFGATPDEAAFWESKLGYFPAPVVEVWQPTAPPAKPANPKAAYGDKKVPVHLVPPALVLGAAKALGEGATKYGAYNWRVTNIEAMTYVGAILRHLYAWQDGEDVDPESTTGKLHIEGIAACVAILLDSHYNGTLVDNRPPKGPGPKMVLTPKDTK